MFRSLVMRFLLLVSGLCLGAIRLSAAPSVFPLKVYEQELPNGLRVMVVPTDFPKIVSVQIPMQTGSRNEVEAGKTGFAHFFEHMMFRGTKTRSASAYQERLNAMGARQNAYTTADYTNYHTTIAKDDLEELLAMEADRFMNLSYGESEFKTEARAVLGEYNKNSANPGSKLWETVKEKAFTTHTYKHTTMGFLADIEAMPQQFDYSKVFFDRWYRPEYATLIVAGDVKPEQVFALAKKYFGPWKRGSYKVNIPAEPPAKGPFYTHTAWENPTLSQLLVGFRGPAFTPESKDFAALTLLYEIAFGETSDLYRRLVLKEAKLNSLSAATGRSRDPDLFLAAATVKNPADMREIRDAILKTFVDFTEAPVDPKRLEAVRSNLRNELARGLDNTESIAGLLASFAHYERRSDTIARSFAAYDKVTVADLQRIAKQTFTDTNLIVSTLSHETLAPELSKTPRLASFQSKASPAASEIKTILQSNKLPFLNIKLSFRAGSAFDPKGKEGLAALSAAMVTEASSQAYDYDYLQKALFPLAASFHQRVDRELSTFTIRTPKDQVGTVLDLLLPSLLTPGLREDDFRRLKQAQINALKNNLRTNNEEELGKERLQELLFQKTSYAHPSLGYLKSLEALTLDDVKEFLAKAYTKQNLVVGVSGDFAKDLKKDLSERLQGLSDGPGLPVPTITPTAPKGLEVDIIQKNTRATAISLGHPMKVTRSHPDFAALWLARAWLGEHRSSMSRLYQRIREIRGMNYGDYAYIEAFPGGMYQFFPPSNVVRQAQLFEIWIRPVMPENAHMALRIALFELDKLLTAGMSEEDFQRTKSYLLKNIYVMTATQDQQLGYAIDSEFYKIPEFTSYMQKQLEKLSLADVNRTLKAHWSSKDLRIVMITQDAEGLKKNLTQDTPSSMRYDGEKPKDLLEEDLTIGQLKLKIPAAAVSITPVEAVFAGS